MQGWFLLYDSNLDPNERNVILAALKEDYSFFRVAQELRNQWSDEDLKKRDQASRGAGWWVDEPEDEEAWSAEPDLNLADYNEEGKALLTEAGEDIAHAWALMEQGKRTLREAREKQHQVRMSRKYYKINNASSFKPRPRFQDSRQQSQGSAKTATCLRCGSSDHSSGACPKALQASTTSPAPSHAAPSVCCTESQDEALVAGQRLTTAEVVAQGKAVLDGGATRTLASVHALEKIMSLNPAQVRRQPGDSS